MPLGCIQTSAGLHTGSPLWGKAACFHKCSPQTQLVPSGIKHINMRDATCIWSTHYMLLDSFTSPAPDSETHWLQSSGFLHRSWEKAEPRVLSFLFPQNSRILAKPTLLENHFSLFGVLECYTVGSSGQCLVSGFSKWHICYESFQKLFKFTNTCVDLDLRGNESYDLLIISMQSACHSIFSTHKIKVILSCFILINILMKIIIWIFYIIISI